MATYTFSCIDGHTCGNPVRLVSGGGPRLEGANKAFGSNILLSGATRAALPAGAPEHAHLLWLDTVVLAGRSAGLDVYTPCDDATLVATSQALHHHLQAAEWAAALACCAQWQAHAHHQAPQWAQHAEQLQARVLALADTASQAPATPPSFGARALDK